MPLSSPSNSLPIRLARMRELQALERENERLRTLIISLRERVSALQPKVSPALAEERLVPDTPEVNARLSEKVGARCH
jgi:hypothetical protein